MPTADTLDVTTSQVIFRDSFGCKEIAVICLNGVGLSDAQIHVEGLHAAGEWFTIPKGTFQRFRLGTSGVRKVMARSSGDASRISYGVGGVERMPHDD